MENFNTNDSIKTDPKFQKINLGLFFTAGISLKKWYEIGSIEREVALYNELSKQFKYIYFFTYGDDDDLKFQKYLASNIKVIPKVKISNPFLYSIFLPLIHYKLLKNIPIIKTNQMMGSWSAVITKIIFKNKLIIRTGYMLSINYSKSKPDSWKNQIIKLIEKIAYSYADGIITSSPTNFQYVEKNYHPQCKHALITNYVDTSIFKPINKKKRVNSICFVGRLTKEKNLINLFKALIDQPFSISIIGKGPLLDELKKISDNYGLNSNFYGKIPNYKLPEVLNEHEIFVIPSLYENMPKALLEAMSCGLPIIGTDVKGINEIISDQKDGILCQTNSKSIKESIIRVMKDEELKNNLGKNARKKIENNYTLKEIVIKEFKFINNIK